MMHYKTNIVEGIQDIFDMAVFAAYFDNARVIRFEFLKDENNEDSLSAWELIKWLSKDGKTVVLAELYFDTYEDPYEWAEGKTLGLHVWFNKKAFVSLGRPYPKVKSEDELYAEAGLEYSEE